MKWTKTNGNTIETNEEKATVDHCLSLGWEKCEEVKPIKRRASRARVVAPAIEEKKPDSFSENAATSGAITQEESNE